MRGIIKNICFVFLRNQIIKTLRFILYKTPHYNYIRWYSWEVPIYWAIHPYIQHYLIAHTHTYIYIYIYTHNYIYCYNYWYITHTHIYICIYIYTTWPLNQTPETVQNLGQTISGLVKTNKNQFSLAQMASEKKSSAHAL